MQVNQFAATTTTEAGGPDAFKCESELFGCNAFALVLNDQEVAVASCTRHSVLRAASLDCRRPKPHLSYVRLDRGAHLVGQIGCVVAFPKRVVRQRVARLIARAGRWLARWLTVGRCLVFVVRGFIFAVVRGLVVGHVIRQRLVPCASPWMTAACDCESRLALFNTARISAFLSCMNSASLCQPPAVFRTGRNLLT